MHIKAVNLKSVLITYESMALNHFRGENNSVSFAACIFYYVWTTQFILIIPPHEYFTTQNPTSSNIN